MNIFAVDIDPVRAAVAAPDKLQRGQRPPNHFPRSD